ncbi:MAG: hypothetical protein FWJ66_00215 [Caldibacillus sp.]
MKRYIDSPYLIIIASRKLILATDKIWPGFREKRMFIIICHYYQETDSGFFITCAYVMKRIVSRSISSFRLNDFF